MPPTSKITALETLMHMDPFTHDVYKEAYIKVEDFKEVTIKLSIISVMGCSTS
jgi:hypothetical protein